MNTSAAIRYSPPQLCQVGVKVVQVPQMQVRQDRPAASSLFKLSPLHPVYDAGDAFAQRPCGANFDPNPGSVDRRRREECQQFVRPGDFTSNLRLEVVSGRDVVDIDEGLSAAVAHTPGHLPGDPGVFRSVRYKHFHRPIMQPDRFTKT
jgi:hypothetical protein